MKMVQCYSLFFISPHLLHVYINFLFRKFFSAKKAFI
nr:MAG TPA: hypothetical protein [Caudoviricetes sp.]